MEVAEEKARTKNISICIRSSSFECDSSSIDSILGLRTDSKAILRIDKPENLAKPDWVANSRRSTSIFSPRELDNSPHELDQEFQRERLLRLLDQQQAWYDAAQQAALAAEQLLSLCEHHQQQWLHLNQQIPTASHPDQ